MNKTLKKLSVTSLLGAAVLFSSVGDVQAARPKSSKSSKKKAVRRGISVSSTKPMLLADKARPEIDTAVLDSILMHMDWYVEDDFPADEIYDSWNTEFVKAYADIEVPDQHWIDVSSFVMPVKGGVTSNYGPRWGRFHYGTDIKLQTGDTVYAAFEGKVRIKQYERGYGYHLVLRHPNGLETVYAHLSGYLVGQDESVEAGQPIALGGSTGRSTGPHLHFEFRFLGYPINPGEIIDFDALCLNDDGYLFEKGKSERSYISLPDRYTAKSKTKINGKTKGKAKATATATANVKYHRVKKGDTLSSISRRYGVSVEKLRKINNMRPTDKVRSSAIRVS
jgi:murein DD-endopeptidase MepM/ murein hydrolase activator NlpD